MSVVFAGFGAVVNRRNESVYVDGRLLRNCKVQYISLQSGISPGTAELIFPDSGYFAESIRPAAQVEIYLDKANYPNPFFRGFGPTHHGNVIEQNRFMLQDERTHGDDDVCSRSYNMPEEKNGGRVENLTVRQIVQDIFAEYRAHQASAGNTFRLSLRRSDIPAVATGEHQVKGSPHFTAIQQVLTEGAGGKYRLYVKHYSGHSELRVFKMGQGRAKSFYRGTDPTVSQGNQRYGAANVGGMERGVDIVPVVNHIKAYGDYRAVETAKDLTFGWDPAIQEKVMNNRGKFTNKTYYDRPNPNYSEAALDVGRRFELPMIQDYWTDAQGNRRGSSRFPRVLPTLNQDYVLNVKGREVDARRFLLYKFAGDTDWRVRLNGFSVENDRTVFTSRPLTQSRSVIVARAKDGSVNYAAGSPPTLQWLSSDETFTSAETDPDTKEARYGLPLDFTNHTYSLVLNNYVTFTITGATSGTLELAVPAGWDDTRLQDFEDAFSGGNGVFSVWEDRSPIAGSGSVYSGVGQLGGSLYLQSDGSDFSALDTGSHSYHVVMGRIGVFGVGGVASPTQLTLTSGLTGDELANLLKYGPQDFEIYEDYNPLVASGSEGAGNGQLASGSSVTYGGTNFVPNDLIPMTPGEYDGGQLFIESKNKFYTIIKTEKNWLEIGDTLLPFNGSDPYIIYGNQDEYIPGTVMTAGQYKGRTLLLGSTWDHESAERYTAFQIIDNTTSTLNLGSGFGSVQVLSKNWQILDMLDTQVNTGTGGVGGANNTYTPGINMDPHSLAGMELVLGSTFADNGDGEQYERHKIINNDHTIITCGGATEDFTGKSANWFIYNPARAEKVEMVREVKMNYAWQSNQKLEYDSGRVGDVSDIDRVREIEDRGYEWKSYDNHYELIQDRGGKLSAELVSGTSDKVKDLAALAARADARIDASKDSLKTHFANLPKFDLHYEIGDLGRDNLEPLEENVLGIYLDVKAQNAQLYVGSQ